MATERERTSLIEKELALFKAIIDSAPEGMVIADEEARIILANPIADLMLERPIPYKQPYASLAELRLVYPDGKPYEARELPLVRSALDGEVFTGVRMAILLPDGERRDLLVNTAPLKDAGGAIIGAVGVFQDITAREILDEEIRASRRQVLDILESISDGFFALDNLWRFTYINGRAQRLLGLRKEDVLFRGIWDKLPNVQVLRLYKELNVAAEGQEASTFEDFIPMLGKWFEFHVYPYELGTSVYFSDITERKWAEEALRKLNRRFDEVLNRLTDGFIILDKEWRHVFVNDKAAADVRLTKEEMLGKSVWELFPQIVGTPLEDGYRRAAREQVPVMLEQRIEELEIWVELRAFPLEEGIAVFGRDITERKKTEQALRESEERFRATFEQAAVGIAHVSLDYRFIRLNQRYADITGYTKEELTAKTFVDITYAEDIEKDVELARRLVAGVINTYHMEKRYIRKDGSVVWVALTVSLVRDEKGAPYYFIAVVDDITDKKRA